ncbi:Hypothetical predicted protein [Cloeon dipterum]|uniref:Beta-1,4-glucuronyltransferase 1 n=1 Tax=Cloeon dipterum TaxID=197152 RepID=A0A8S1D5Z8_9INSE|nr:Hypothetical predicted protein [Cloeon dipterum]
MCHASMRDQISWHLSLPKEIPPTQKYLHFLRRKFNCSVTGVQITKLLLAEVSDEDKKEVENLRYPQNAMRNLARRFCKTEWVLCPDVDMVFPDTLPNSESMHSKLNRFLKSEKARNCEKCAFVFPVYEIENVKERVPESKAALLQYLAEKKAQIYHITIFAPNQLSSNLSVWEKLPLQPDVDIALPVDFNFYYEPVYVTRHGSPKFDERYIGYGMTRNTQALEMHLDGYRFFVLDSIFLSHLWGILQNKPLPQSAPRKRQLQLNIKLFYTFFIRELALRYQINMDSEVLAKIGRRPTKFTYLPKVNIVYANNKR